MKWLRNLLNAPMRGRVHRMSVTKGGEVSIVVRFGMEEMRARQLNQGLLLDIVPHTAGKAALAIHFAEKKKRKPSDTTTALLPGSGSVLDVGGTGWTKPEEPHEKLVLYAGPGAKEVGSVVVPPGSYDIVVKGQKLP